MRWGACSGLFIKTNPRIVSRINCAGGKRLWVKSCGTKIITNDGRAAVISVIMDISKHIMTERRLIEEAEHDSLTGIYNRKTNY